jgi:GNAT superfamily N-acetyltransferase
MTRQVLVRPARPEEVDALPDLEVASGALFQELAMDRVAQDAPPPVATFARAQSEDLLLVAADVPPEGDAVGIAGFVRLEVLDGALHVAQLSVAPAHGRRGIGTRLMRAAEDLARERGFVRMTLTTFRDVPFNGPFYARLGWSVVPPDEMTPGLAAARQHEIDLGLDEWPRQAMHKAVSH